MSPFRLFRKGDFLYGTNLRQQLSEKEEGGNGIFSGCTVAFDKDFLLFYGETATLPFIYAVLAQTLEKFVVNFQQITIFLYRQVAKK